MFAPEAQPQLAPPPQQLQQPMQAQPEPPPPQKEAEQPAAKADEGSIYDGRDQFGGASIINSKSAAGATVGYLNMPEVPYATHYLHINPFVELKWPKKKFAMALNVPLNFVLYSANPSVSMWSIRQEDWNDYRDFGKIIKYLQYGRKFDKLYINVTTMFASTLGHGFIMRRYIPNVMVDVKKLGFQLDYNHDYFGFESTFSDVMYYPVIGLMPFVRPFAWHKSEILKSLSIGATFVFDTQTPVVIERDFGAFGPDSPAAKQYGGYFEYGTQQNGNNYYYSFPNGKPMVNSDHQLVLADSSIAFVYGFDAHVKVYKSKNVDIKPYMDFSILNGGGGGYTAGCHWRFNIGDKTRSLFSIRTDFRTYAPNYEPTYFDSFYEIQKYQYVVPDRLQQNYTKGVYPTKYAMVTNRDGDWRYGYYLEFNYEIPKWFGIGFSLSDGSSGNLTYYGIGQARNGSGVQIFPGQGYFQAHIDLPLPKWVSLHGTYHKVGFKEYSEIFDFNSGNSIFLATLKIRPVNFIGIYATLQESWELDNWTGLYELIPAFQAGIDLSYNFDL
jgi:hypothetical protein